ncbi:helix-turn-helix transcriptional regulator [Arachidicoccus soli]|uniref:XRE family transcriptional regulator n=1 Tax=Arachidicoccus soli TaxID=2341117 RepID=A0A386HQW0_9BACT|nr:helix-turn-helix transcriptional regulator [Arachidicoccus soli]AYD48235.1 XRE family transcriptional regulator [Arachidicoccus soli]
MENYFADNLILLRKAYSKTQSVIALQVKKSQRIVSNWERKETQPSIEEIGIISEYFGISAHELLFIDLSNAHLTKKEVGKKNEENAHPIAHPSAHLNDKKGKNYEVGEGEFRQVAQESAMYAVASQSNKMEGLYQSQINTLNALISAKDAIIAQLSTDNERLKRDNAILESAVPSTPQLTKPKATVKGS